MTLRGFGLCGFLLAACSEGGSTEKHPGYDPDKLLDSVRGRYGQY